jgi:perosamine synthetase
MYRIPVSRPKISRKNIKKVSQALKETNISGHANGVSEFENKLADYLGVDHVVAVANGTVALDLAIDVLEISENDECVVPTFTIISTINQLVRKKAKIILVDADPDTWSLDVTKTLEVLNSKTKLVLPVHIYGLPVDMQPLIDYKIENNYRIAEDAAEALGVEYRGKKCGSFGDLATFSFYANKLITTGEGGAIAVKDFQSAEKLRNLRNLNFIPGKRFVSDNIGYNARLNNLSAQLGISQLDEIEKLQNIRISLAERYREGLRDHPWLEFQIEKTDYAINKYWVFGIKLKKEAPLDAPTLTNVLSTYGIESRRFFCPLHLQPVIKKNNVSTNGSLMISEELWERGLYLPFGNGITSKEVEIVIDIIWKIFRNYCKGIEIRGQF